MKKIEITDEMYDFLTNLKNYYEKINCKMTYNDVLDKFVKILKACLYEYNSEQISNIFTKSPEIEIRKIQLKNERWIV